MPISLMIVRTSAKSRLMRPWTVIRSEMPRTACSSTSSAFLKVSRIDMLRPAIDSRRWLGIAISVSTLSFSSRMPSSACLIALLALEEERLGHHADGERAELLGEPRHDRRSAGAGAAAHAGGDEHHVRAREVFADPLDVLVGRLAADLRIGAGAEPLGDLSPSCSLTARGSRAAPARRCWRR